MITRILLDTCTVRNHLHQSNEKIDLHAINLRRWKYRISMADSTMAELMSQLLENRLSLKDWESRIGDFDSILDPNWPIFPGGRELAVLSGAAPPHGFDIRDSQLYYQAGWRLMREAANIKDLTSGLIFTDTEGRQQKIYADKKHVMDTMQRERDFWINYIKCMQNLLIDRKSGSRSVEAIIELMRSDLGARSGDPPDLAQKYDAVSRMIAIFVDSSLQANTPYNPCSEKRRGDVFDLGHLFAIPLSAIICTTDKPFVNRFRASKSPQSNQVLTPEELNEHARKDTLETILGSAYYRDQLQRWQSNAFKRWQQRFQPQHDDWADWFAAEPIA